MTCGSARFTLNFYSFHNQTQGSHKRVGQAIGPTIVVNPTPPAIPIRGIPTQSGPLSRASIPSLVLLADRAVRPLLRSWLCLQACRARAKCRSTSLDPATCSVPSEGAPGVTRPRSWASRCWALKEGDDASLHSAPAPVSTPSQWPSAPHVFTRSLTSFGHVSCP